MVKLSVFSKRGVRFAAMAGALGVAAGCSQPPVAAGPPCPTVDAAAFAAQPYRVKPDARFQYSAAVFGRALGHADCEDRRTGFLGFSKYAVCNFTGPAVLEIELNGEHDYYTPGVGKPVRVTVEGGAARCEMAGPAA